MVKHQTFLSGIDHFAVIQSFEFLRQLGFPGQLFQDLQHIVIHLLGSIIICHTFRHGNTVLFHTLSTALPGHHLSQIHLSGR